MDNNSYCEITPEILKLAAMSEEAGIIDTELFTKYEVKRGLRDLNLFSARRLVNKLAAFDADSLTKTFGDLLLRLRIDELEFQGGTAAVDY